MRKTVAIAFASLFILSSGTAILPALAASQTSASTGKPSTSSNPVRPARAAAKVSQVTVQFSARGWFNTPTPSAEDLAELRAKIYESAAAECEILLKAFPGECRLRNLTIADPNRRGTQAYPGELSASASYELVSSN